VRWASALTAGRMTGSMGGAARRRHRRAVHRASSQGTVGDRSPPRPRRLLHGPRSTSRRRSAAQRARAGVDRHFVQGDGPRGARARSVPRGRTPASSRPRGALGNRGSGRTGIAPRAPGQPRRRRRCRHTRERAAAASVAWGRLLAGTCCDLSAGGGGARWPNIVAAELGRIERAAKHCAARRYACGTGRCTARVWYGRHDSASSPPPPTRAGGGEAPVRCAITASS
jgi:hypothetical protein